MILSEKQYFNCLRQKIKYTENCKQLSLHKSGTAEGLDKGTEPSSTMKRYEMYYKS